MRWLAWVAAAGVVAVALWVVYPGWYSFDSAQLLAQARTGAYSNLQPPATAALWSLLLRAGLPPGAMLVLAWALLVTGLALLQAAVAPRWRTAALLLPLVPLLPPLLVLLAHAWTDVLLAGALMCGAGLIAQAQARRSRALAIAAVLVLLGAATLRHNAVFALPPLFAWLLHTWPARRAMTRIAMATGTAALLVAAVASDVVLDRMLVQQRTVSWTPTAAWDLAAVSARTGHVLLPDRMHGPALTATDLAATVNADTALDTVLSPRTPIDLGILAPLPDATLSELRRRWLSLPFTYPQHYLAHRAAVAWSLLGPQRTDKRESLYFTPGVTTAAGNPTIAANTSAANRALVELAREQRASWRFAPLTWLLPGVAALALTFWRAAPTPARDAARALAISGWLYVLCLLPLAPAAEVRYVLWAMLACPVALLLALVALVDARDIRRAPRTRDGRAAPFTAGADL